VAVWDDAAEENSHVYVGGVSDDNTASSPNPALGLALFHFQRNASTLDLEKRNLYKLQIAGAWQWAAFAK